MITQSKLLDTDLWEAWIDLVTPGCKGVATLFVIGSVGVNNTILEPRFEKINDPLTPNRLVLSIVPNVLCEDGLETEILYAEDIADVDQYTGVTIMFNDRVIVEIDELECLH